MASRPPADERRPTGADDGQLGAVGTLGFTISLCCRPAARSVTCWAAPVWLNSNVTVRMRPVCGPRVATAPAASDGETSRQTAASMPSSCALVGSMAFPFPGLSATIARAGQSPRPGRSGFLPEPIRSLTQFYASRRPDERFRYPFQRQCFRRRIIDSPPKPSIAIVAGSGTAVTVSTVNPARSPSVRYSSM